MRFIRTKAWALGAALLLAPLASANEAKEESGGGEHGGAPAADAPSKDQKEFADKSAKLTSLSNRIEEAEKKFLELVHHKSTAHSTEDKQAAIKEMVEVANQRNKDVDAFNKLKSELTYRYPYQGEKLNRRYGTQRERSAEEMEAAGGLDELLTRTKKVVERKFAPFMQDEPKPAPKPKVAQPGAEKPARLKLEK